MGIINVKKADIDNSNEIKKCITKEKLSYFNKVYAKDTITLIKTLLENKKGLYNYKNSILFLEDDKVELLGITATKKTLESFQQFLDSIESKHKSFTGKLQKIFEKTNPISVKSNELYLEILGKKQEKTIIDIIVKYAKIEALQKNINNIVVYMEKSNSSLLPLYKSLGFIEVERLSSIGLSKGECIKLKLEVK